MFLNDGYVFKIRNNRTGKYSTGGQYPSWSKVGKIWKSENDLNKHLKIVDANFYDEDCVIEKYFMKYYGSYSLKR
jgi:hypothetical protein